MRTFVLMSSVAGALVASAASGQIIPIGTFGGSAYYANMTPASWQDARDTAAAFQANSRLWTVNSQAEHDFVLAWARSLDPNSPVFWIGMNAESNPGGGLSSFQWISGEPVTFTKFAGDAVFNDPYLSYTSFNWTLDGVWNNLGPTGLVAPGATFFGLKRSIIEVVPAPGPAALLGLGGLMALRRRR